MCDCLVRGSAFLRSKLKLRERRLSLVNLAMVYKIWKKKKIETKRLANRQSNRSTKLFSISKISIDEASKKYEVNQKYLKQSDTIKCYTRSLIRFCAVEHQSRGEYFVSA